MEKIGSGRRFRRLEGKLAAKGAANPSALAAYIGRRQYGAERMQELAQAAKRRRAREGAPSPEAPPPAARRVKV